MTSYPTKTNIYSDIQWVYSAMKRKRLTKLLLLK
nr:MAG TPA: hypothetical protein [Caudoviricetes sp.]